MITKIILNNFKSFKNPVTIDLMKTNYTMLPSNVADCGVLKGCVFVGANASGKSNIIIGIKLLLDFMFSEKNIDAGLMLCMFGKSREYSLTYEFLIDGKRIRYTFKIEYFKPMISEQLFIDDKLFLERIGTSAKSFIADPLGISYDEKDVSKDTLFLRTLYFNTKFASNSTLEKWMQFLKNSFYIDMFEKMIVSYDRAKVSIHEFLDDNGCKIINDFFDEYNFEQSVEYEHSTKGGRLRWVVGDNEDEKSIFFKRKSIDTPIPFEEESLGNQNLLRILPTFFSVIKNGGMLLADEFSSGFHNELEKLLIKYFMEKSNNSQLLFVSHSTNLLSNAILRPDQEYSVEFHGENGSSVRRFSEEQPRAAQNVEKMYVSGVFGGLPRYNEVNNED